MGAETARPQREDLTQQALFFRMLDEGTTLTFCQLGLGRLALNTKAKLKPAGARAPLRGDLAHRGARSFRDDPSFHLGHRGEHRDSEAPRRTGGVQLLADGH